MGWAEYADVCIPQPGPYLSFDIKLVRFGGLNWTDAVCIENRDIRFMRDTTTEKANTLNASAMNFAWKKNADCIRPEDILPWVVDQPQGRQIYIVSITSGGYLPSPPFEPNTPYFPHAMIVEDLGGPGGLANSSNRNFYQYDQTNVQPARPIPNESQWQLPIPMPGDIPTHVIIRDPTHWDENHHLQGESVYEYWIDKYGNESQSAPQP
ncbi:MAG: hypothetical protein Q8O06_02720 [Acetobacterium sp.]|nr:hypothetical protein [Acetobacterium sp.]